jgi:hypothetical protein
LNWEGYKIDYPQMKSTKPSCGYVFVHPSNPQLIDTLLKEYPFAKKPLIDSFNPNLNLYKLGPIPANQDILTAVLNNYPQLNGFNSIKNKAKYEIYQLTESLYRLNLSLPIKKSADLALVVDIMILDCKLSSDEQIRSGLVDQLQSIPPTTFTNANSIHILAVGQDIATLDQIASGINLIKISQPQDYYTLYPEFNTCQNNPSCKLATQPASIWSGHLLALPYQLPQDGLYTIQTKTYDNQLNLTDSQLQLIKDTTAPVVTNFVFAPSKPSGDKQTVSNQNQVQFNIQDIGQNLAIQNNLDTAGKTLTYSYSTDNQNWSNWISLDTGDNSINIDHGDIVLNQKLEVYFKFKDITDNETTVFSDYLTVNSLPPVVELDLNKGQATINNLEVEYELKIDTQSDIARLKLATSSEELEETEWENYTINTGKYTFKLEDDQELADQMLCVVIENIFAQSSNTDCKSVTIDLRKPSGKLTLDKGSEKTFDNTVSVQIEASDPSFENTDNLEMKWSTDGVNFSPYQPFQSDFEHTFDNQFVGTAQLFFILKNSLGNESLAFSDQILIDPLQDRSISINNTNPFTDSTQQMVTNAQPEVSILDLSDQSVMDIFSSQVSFRYTLVHSLEQLESLKIQSPKAGMIPLLLSNLIKAKNRSLLTSSNQAKILLLSSTNTAAMNSLSPYQTDLYTTTLTVADKLAIDFTNREELTLPATLPASKDLELNITTTNKGFQTWFNNIDPKTEIVGFWIRKNDISDPTDKAQLATMF